MKEKKKEPLMCVPDVMLALGAQLLQHFLRHCLGLVRITCDCGTHSVAGFVVGRSLFLFPFSFFLICKTKCGRLSRTLYSQ